MQPWQVSFGVSLAVIAPVMFMVYEELAYLASYWHLAWGHYGIHMLMVPLMFTLGVIFGVYALARTIVLGDVGSRIGVLDKPIREGRAGDEGLSLALQRARRKAISSRSAVAAVGLAAIPRPLVATLPAARVVRGSRGSRVRAFRSAGPVVSLGAPAAFPATFRGG